MKQLAAGLYQNITLLDVQLARVYLPFLVELARKKGVWTYSELVDAAKRAHPDLCHVQNAIPVSAGRRLEVIRLYCNEEGIPDLASLVVSKASGECGSFYVENFDPVSARAAVYARDWKGDIPDIDGYFDYSERQVKPRKVRKVEEARQIMSDHYRANRSRYPLSITEVRSFIIERLVEGLDAEEAFEQALAALSDASPP